MGGAPCVDEGNFVARPQQVRCSPSTEDSRPDDHDVGPGDGRRCLDNYGQQNCAARPRQERAARDVRERWTGRSAASLAHSLADQPRWPAGAGGGGGGGAGQTSAAKITEPSGQVCVAGADGGSGGGTTVAAMSAGADRKLWRSVSPIVRGWPML